MDNERYILEHTLAAAMAFGDKFLEDNATNGLIKRGIPIDVVESLKESIRRKKEDGEFDSLMEHREYFDLDDMAHTINNLGGAV